VATPAPLRTPQGVPFLAWGGSYVSVFPWVPGRVLARAEVTPAHARAAAVALAGLHRAGADLPDHRPGRYEPDEIRRKFKSAVTDTGREVRRAADKPGISNLVEIMAVARATSPPEVEAQYEGQGYGKFKTDVGEAVIELLAPIKKRYLELRGEITRP